MRYFTWKLELVSNVLWMVVASEPSEFHLPDIYAQNQWPSPKKGTNIYAQNQWPSPKKGTNV